MATRNIPVNLESQAAVKAIAPEFLEYEQQGSQHQLDCYTTIWTAGSTVHPLIKNLPISQDLRDRRYKIMLKIHIYFAISSST